MSYPVPPSSAGRYPDFTRATAAIQNEALALRRRLAWGALVPPMWAAAFGAMYGRGACELLFSSNLLARPTGLTWSEFASGGAMLGILIGLTSARGAMGSARLHVGEVLDNGLLSSVLGPDVRSQLPRLHAGRYSYWPSPDNDTVHLRIRGLLGNYMTCAEDRGMPAFPSTWFWLALVCGLVSVAVFFLYFFSWSLVGGDHLISSSEPLIRNALAYFGSNRAFAWFSCIAATLVCSVAASLASAMAVGTRAAIADKLEQFADRIPEATSVSRVDDPQTDAYDDVPTGWS